MSSTIRSIKRLIALLSVIALIFAGMTACSLTERQKDNESPPAQGQDEPKPNEPPVTPVEPEPEPEIETELYHETFANGKGAAAQAGGASVKPVTDKVFDGNEDGAALYISNRANNWDAADFKFTDTGLENGMICNITVKGYVDADAEIPAGGQAWLQAVDSYQWVGGVDYVAGQAFTLTGKYTVDTSKDGAIRVMSSEEGKEVPFYIGEITITGKKGEAQAPVVTAPRDPAIKFEEITFEDNTTQGFAGRAGTETLTVTDEANHTQGGKYALKIEGRTTEWHGPSLNVEKYVDEGMEYKISAWVKLINPASSQLQLSTQVGNGDSANYVNLSPKTVSTKDGWVQFEGTYRYSNASSNYITIYVESANNATASFYIDDISFQSTGAGAIAVQKDLTPIKDVYKDDFLYGNAISVEDMNGVRLELLKMHHNVATAGNAMKPAYLQSTKGNFNFDAADQLVDKVLAEGMKMHGHTLVWHQQSPEWMNQKEDGTYLGREEALENLRTHIKGVVEHFGDKVISWDVVNEGMNDNPPKPSDWKASLRKSPWYHAIGDDYVEQAFLAAREVLDQHPEWDIKLYYNDYNDDNQSKATAIYNMVKEINERYAEKNPGKLLIDGVGMQGHYSINTNPANVELSLERFASLGVEVSITELDIMTGDNFELSEKQANAQGLLYAELFKVFRKHKDNIARVTVWGMDDGTSWRAAQNPTVFDKDLQAKAAYYGIIDPDKFSKENTVETVEANKSSAKFGTPQIDGKIDAAWKNAPELQINRYQTAWQGATGIAKVLWDDKNLYVLYQVSDAQLDKASENAWEQDSVEAFVDENNAKTTFYEDDDGQFRVNFENAATYNPEGIENGFKSEVIVSGTNYTIEMQIPFRTISPKAGMEIGFDAQINDGKDGARQSVATWNDLTGNGYQDTSVFGIITLEK